MTEYVEVISGTALVLLWNGFLIWKMRKENVKRSDNQQ
jgi:hypothetical protein